MLIFLDKNHKNEGIIYDGDILLMDNRLQIFDVPEPFIVVQFKGGAFINRNGILGMGSGFCGHSFYEVITSIKYFCYYLGHDDKSIEKPISPYT